MTRKNVKGIQFFSFAEFIFEISTLSENKSFLFILGHIRCTGEGVNTDVLTIEPSRTNFSEFLIEMQTF